MNNSAFVILILLFAINNKLKNELEDIKGKIENLTFKK